MSKSSTFASRLINSEKQNFAHMEKKKREAYPEPEPEPEPESEPRPKTLYGQQSSSSIYRKVSSSQPYSSYYSSLPGYRYKRSPEPEPEPESEPLPRYQSQSGQADGGYQGSYRGSKTRYTYGGYLHRHKRDTSRLENNDVAVLKEGKIVYKTIYDKLTDMVKTTKLNRRSKRSVSTNTRKQPSYIAPDIADGTLHKTQDRSKRHINMEVLMEVLGKKKRPNKPELLYMTAKIKPKEKIYAKLHMHTIDYQDHTPVVASHDEHPEYGADSQVSGDGYVATDSNRNIMSKA